MVRTAYLFVLSRIEVMVFHFYAYVTSYHRFQAQLGTKASKVKTTRKLQSHPCVITVEEMAAARLS
jgi:hypothetical protein